MFFNTYFNLTGPSNSSKARRLVLEDDDDEDEEIDVEGVQQNGQENGSAGKRGRPKKRRIIDDEEEEENDNEGTQENGAENNDSEESEIEEEDNSNAEVTYLNSNLL